MNVALRGALSTAAATVATVLLVGFLAVPLVALVTAVPPSRLPGLVFSAETLNALRVTIGANIVATLVMLGLGTPAAYLLARSQFRGRSLVVTLIELPLVLPPAVAGIALIAAFGVGGPLGAPLADLGVVIPFTEVAVVMAVVFVASPFYLRAAIAAFSAIDPTLLEAARTLGAGRFRVFWRLAVPMAGDGLRSGWALAFARGIGEFGATLVFAGSVVGVTQTLPLAVYAELSVSLDGAIAIGVLLLAISAVILLVAKVPRPWTP